MSNVEGVKAEETTVEESVENPTPEPVETEVSEEGETEEAENAEQQQESSLTDEELDKLLDDPKAKKRIEERIEKEVEIKTSRQKAANRQLQRKYEDIRERLQKLKEQELPQKPELSDFETDAEYEKAVEEYNDERVTRKAQEAMLEQEAQAAAQEQVAQARQAFEEQEQAFIKENPDYTENTKVVQEYINMVDKNDPGFQEFGRYVAFECENAPALLNHLGANPDKIEALLGKPPALIKRKLQGYMKELAPAPKEPPAPLPEPPKKAKGTATPKKTLDDATSVLDALGLRKR